MNETVEQQGTSGSITFASVFIVVGILSHISTGMTFVPSTRWAFEMTDFTSESTLKLLGWINLEVAALMIATLLATAEGLPLTEIPSKRNDGKDFSLPQPTRAMTAPSASPTPKS